MRDKHKTAVLFRMFKGEVLALFPEHPGTRQRWTCDSYAHTGQHGTADMSGVIRGSRQATMKQYAPLARELRRIGYNLKIVKRVTPTMNRARYAALGN